MFPQYSPAFERFPRFLSLFGFFGVSERCVWLLYVVFKCWIQLDGKLGYQTNVSCSRRLRDGRIFFPRSCIGKNWMIWMFFLLHYTHRFQLRFQCGFKCYVFDRIHSLLNPGWLVKFRHKIILLASDHLFQITQLQRMSTDGSINKFGEHTHIISVFWAYHGFWFTISIIINHMIHFFRVITEPNITISLGEISLTIELVSSW